MRLSVVVWSVLCACGPSQEAKPIEIVNIPQPVSSAKPAAIATAEPPEQPGRPITAGGPAMKARDPRRLVMKPGEVDSLRALLDATAKSAPDRPAVLRRLAEAEVALSRANAADGTDATTPASRAIEAYKTIVTDYPSLSTKDEVLYYLALEYELTGDARSARARYYDVIRERPSSKFIPYAYFAFGELFFLEAAQDPTKLDLAEQAFREVMKYPKENNPLFAAGLYRMGLVYKQKGDPTKSREQFSRLDRDFRDSEEAKLPR